MTDIDSFIKILEPILNDFNPLNYFNQNYISSNSLLTCRGYCGVINMDQILCKVLISELNLMEHINNDIIMYKYPINNIYIKKCCICQNNCKNSNSCIKTSGVNCNGHYILIISTNDDTIVNNDDYVLDYTYKQMLVSRNNENKYRTYLEQLPRYLLLKSNIFFSNIFFTFPPPPFNNEISTNLYNKILNFWSKMLDLWNKNITSPCKFIISCNCEKNLYGGNIKKKLNSFKNIKNPKIVKETKLIKNSKIVKETKLIKNSKIVKETKLIKKPKIVKETKLIKKPKIVK
jgi:hypothetical protein